MTTSPSTNRRVISLAREQQTHVWKLYRTDWSLPMPAIGISYRYHRQDRLDMLVDKVI